MESLIPSIRHLYCWWYHWNWFLLCVFFLEPVSTMKSSWPCTFCPSSFWRSQLWIQHQICLVCVFAGIDWCFGSSCSATHFGLHCSFCLGSFCFVCCLCVPFCLLLWPLLVALCWLLTNLVLLLSASATAVHVNTTFCWAELVVNVLFFGCQSFSSDCVWLFDHMTHDGFKLHQPKASPWDSRKGSSILMYNSYTWFYRLLKWWYLESTLWLVLDVLCDLDCRCSHHWSQQVCSWWSAFYKSCWCTSHAALNRCLCKSGSEILQSFLTANLTSCSFVLTIPRLHKLPKSDWVRSWSFPKNQLFSNAFHMSPLLPANHGYSVFDNYRLQCTAVQHIKVSHHSW